MTIRGWGEVRRYFHIYLGSEHYFWFNISEKSYFWEYKDSITKSDFFYLFIIFFGGGGGSFLYILGLFKVKIQNGNIFIGPQIVKYF